MDRAQKREFVETMHDELAQAGTVVVAHYAGLSVAEMTDFRVRMKEAGATVKVAKNRLVKLALDGTGAAVAKDLFSGPTVVAYSKDPIAAPKVAVGYAKGNDKFVILGGAMGATALDAAGVKALADLPSLDELRARIVGMIATPATRVAQILQAPAAQIARVMGAYAAKDNAA